MRYEISDSNGVSLGRCSRTSHAAFRDSTTGALSRHLLGLAIRRAAICRSASALIPPATTVRRAARIGLCRRLIANRQPLNCYFSFRECPGGGINSVPPCPGNGRRPITASKSQTLPGSLKVFFSKFLTAP